ncbi:MAG: caspase family protein, partial [Chitinophagaceae bacterium]
MWFLFTTPGMAKGVTLTVIFDSCHSGSVGRGVFDISSVRYIEEGPLDAKDPSDPSKPEERGALLLSAAQDFEFAKEIKDENNIPHGAFTVALLKALQQTPSDASVENIFSSLKAIMKFYGKTQEPVLAGNEQRLKGTLFGQPKGSGKTHFSIAVSKSDANELELMGGYAFGLSVGTRLKSSVGTDTIEVVELIGANRSVAKLVSTKKAAISPGALFDVITWSSSG